MNFPINRSSVVNSGCLGRGVDGGHLRANHCGFYLQGQVLWRISPLVFGVSQAPCTVATVLGLGWGKPSAQGQHWLLEVCTTVEVEGFPCSALHWHSQAPAEEEFPRAYTCAWWVSTRFILRKLQEPFPHKDSQPILCSSCQREDHRGNTPSLPPHILTLFNQRHCELETDKLYLEYGTAQRKRAGFQWKMFCRVFSGNDLESVLMDFAL